MIAWATLDAAIKAQVLACAPVTDVRWAWEPSKFTKPVRIRMKRSPISVVGMDARVHDYDADDDALYAYQVGARTFSVEIRCESIKGAPSDSAPVDCADVLSVLVTRLRRPSVVAALKAGGCSISSFTGIVRTTYEVEEREYGLAIVTVTMLAADVDLDTSAMDASDTVGADDIIETATGDLTGTSPDDSDRVVPWSTSA